MDARFRRSGLSDAQTGSRAIIKANTENPILLLMVLLLLFTEVAPSLVSTDLNEMFFFFRSAVRSNGNCACFLC